MLGMKVNRKYWPKIDSKTSQDNEAGSKNEAAREARQVNALWIMVAEHKREKAQWIILRNFPTFSEKIFIPDLFTPNVFMLINSQEENKMRYS